MSAAGLFDALIATRVRAALLVSLVAAVLVVPPIGQRILATGPMNGDDEARYALLARDMLARGVWFDLRYRGVVFRDKPPLYPWTIAGASWLGGRVTPATAQLPVALAAIATVLLTFLFGDRLFGRRAAVWAALVLATTTGFLDLSQLLLPDMLVVCFATLAGLGGWLMVSGAPDQRAVLLFYGATALAVFAKGPLGAIPVLAVAAWLWAEHGPRGLRRLANPWGISLFAVLTAAWVVPFLALGARTWLKNSVKDDWLRWYLGGPGKLDHFFPEMLTWSLPWTMLSILAIPVAFKAWWDSRVRYALLWFAVPFVILMLSAHQKSRYLLATYPGQALLVAWWADVHGARHSAVRRVIGWLTLAFAALIVVKLYVPRWWGPDDERRYLMDTPWWVIAPVAVGLVAIAALVFSGLRWGRPALLVNGTAIAMVALWGYGVWPLNQRYNEIWNFPELAARLERSAQGGEVAVFQHRDDWMSIDFYLGRRPQLMFVPEQVNELFNRDRRSIVVMDEVTWERIGRSLTPGARVREEMTIGGQRFLVVGIGA